MNLVGSPLLKLVFRIFVVFVGIIILSGAVNTSLIGANGVLNRIMSKKWNALKTLHRRIPGRSDDRAHDIVFNVTTTTRYGPVTL